MADTSASIALATAIAVASVAGAISVFNLLVDKDQKISEYRQKWLEDVRSDVASLVSQAHLLYGYLNILIGSPNTPGDKNRYLEKTDPIYDEINRASTRLKLRLNSSKPDHEAITSQLQALENILADVDEFRTHLLAVGSIQVSKEVNETTDALVKAASVVIKSTWERVKAGEPTYQKSKWLIVGLTVLFAVLFGGALWENIRHQPAPPATPPVLCHEKPPSAASK